MYKDVEAVFDIDDLLDLAFKAVFKKGWTTLQSTGLVFAGYGARDYFPRLLNYMCYGVLVGKLVCNHLKDEDAQISHENVAEIKPLAQSDMVKTFMYGTSISGACRDRRPFHQSTR